MATAQVHLSRHPAKALEQLAEREGSSLGDLIRRSIDAFLSARKAPTEDRVMTEARAEAKTRALAAIGRFHSGVSDLAAEHDRYLAEAFGD